MLSELKEEVYRANMELVRSNLVVLTWGNVSGLSEDGTRVVIKPSGIAYSEMTPEDMVVLDLLGNVVEGKWKPSSDTPTHLYLYRYFDALGGIVHTHSTWATMFAQARREIPCFGTTHADHFHGSVPLTRPLTKTEVDEDYEKNTGVVIRECFEDRSSRFPIANRKPEPLDPKEFPGVLVAGHGPFTWGKDVSEAVHNAVALESIAQMAFGTEMLHLRDSLIWSDLGLSPTTRLESYVLEKHYQRKHGTDAYYGQ